MAFIKLSHFDISNCIQAFEEFEELSESEVRTLEKLKLIRASQSVKNEMKRRDKGEVKLSMGQSNG